MQNNLLNLANEVGHKLKSLNVRLTTAESCTGGGLSYYLTMIPGSSAWFERGFVTYSNEAKIELLQVDKDIIAHFGAVSRETAEAMAKGALAHSAAQASLAITGIAGPEGGSKEKPVGTVCFALVSQKIQLETQYFNSNRIEIREQAIRFALNMLMTSIDFIV